MLAQKLLSGGGEADPTYVEDVFKAYARTGTGTDVTITSGIDMTKGYMLWSKRRNGATAHAIYDSARGVTLDLASNSTNGQTTQANGLKSVSATGYTIGSLSTMNASTATYVNFIFRKAPKFFDVVTYTGDGVYTPRLISHSLGVAPGLIIIKRTNGVGNWNIWHRSLIDATGSNSNDLAFDSGPSDNHFIFSPGASQTSSVFGISGGSTSVNNISDTFVAYLFAHDSSANGIVQCDSFMTDGSGNATVNHGWAAGVQFVMIKSSSATGDWEMFDKARSSWSSNSDARLLANLSSTEDYVTRLSASGTSVTFTGLSTSSTYIYLLIVSPT